MSLSRRVKSLLGAAAFRSGLHRRLLGNRAVITVFHRVAEGVPDNYLTCPPDRFRRFCTFFRRHFRVVPLAELLDRVEAGADLTGLLVVTFDDGYEDNHSVAAPILEDLGLPATFFVTSGFIGSDTGAPWDVARGIEAPWMSWDQLRGLAAAPGFAIGGHTVTHADLGQISGSDAMDEIMVGKRMLESELGESVEHFAYPFGGRDRITEANRRNVREAGFRCCLSAYGGLVGPGADPYRLRRVAITDWHRSPEQWGFELLSQAPSAAA